MLRSLARRRPAWPVLPTDVASNTPYWRRRAGPRMLADSTVRCLSPLAVLLHRL